ncbi:MAG: DNA cytosine methyltransferase [Deltaproteobacteria bacterium]|jgi:DNA (cytosine-5)-methyltransferase 1|nr:DNA cytosine methyltransferase [Deltaproteobacteria bacterium]
MSVNATKTQHVAVDLFCGGGGLTVGLKNAGFNVVAAVEMEPAAASTFQVNHPETTLFYQDIRYVSGRDLLKQSPTGEIDLLSGCPPCQGFTSLTAKYRRDDPRNNLVNEMSRLIEETAPKAVMMENVPGLAKRGKHLLDPMCQRLEESGYEITLNTLQVADYGVPQFRKRLVLLAGRGFSISMPQPTHSSGGDNGLPMWRTVREAISKYPTPITFSVAKFMGKLPSREWHVVRDLSALNIARLRVAKPGAGWESIPESLRPPCHQGKYRGFSNVYGRMEWDRISPTITGGCTTLSRGRYGHPVEDRTISVREAATLQTFPEDYIFDTQYMDKVCNIIGNALPCEFARLISSQCLKALQSAR